MFELELDIVKFTEESDGVKLVGFLGEILNIQYEGETLWFNGCEGDLKIWIKKEELYGI
jgi:hypothetical protein